MRYNPERIRMPAVAIDAISKTSDDDTPYSSLASACASTRSQMVELSGTHHLITSKHSRRVPSGASARVPLHLQRLGVSSLQRGRQCEVYPEQRTSRPLPSGWHAHDVQSDFPQRLGPGYELTTIHPK
jgi:hypothetical protein